MLARSEQSRQQRHGRWTWALALLAAFSFTCGRQADRPVQIGPESSPPDGASVETPAAAPVSKQAALPAKAESRSGNTACLNCHAHRSFEKELISRVHERRSVFCADCHGTSDAHAAGGASPPAPDRVFARDEIDAFCFSCHQPRHSPSMIERTVRRWEGRLRPNGRTATVDSVCTDCHGTHVTPAGG